MIKTKETFLSILTDLNTISENTKLNFNEITNIKETIKSIRLLVPVVGDFSAGKSTLLNKFIGKDILAVNDLPETAIATELYYSEEEYIEAVDKDGNIIKLDSFNKEEATNYSYIRRFINSENLKKIEPFILVDMPGFDSPSDSHNSAIISYLDKGIYYIVLSSINAGTTSRSLITQIKNIKSFKKDFSFFITKSELRDENTLNEVKKEITTQLNNIDIYNKEIEHISSTDINLFDNMITKLNPELIFNSIFIDIMKNIVYEIQSSINMKIHALKKDKKENDKVIEELKEAIKKIEAKRDALIEEEKNNEYEIEIGSIIQDVGRELNNNIDNLVNIGVDKGPEALKDEILNIIQPTIISKTNRVIENINININTQFMNDVKNLDTVLANYNIPNFFEKINKGWQDYKDKIKIPETDTENAEKIKKTKDATRAVLAVGAIVTSFINPLIEILIVMLPDLLNLAFVGIQKLNQKNQLKNDLISQIPKIKQELRKHVLSVLKENSNNVINSISESFDEELKRKQEEMEKVQEELNNKSDIDNLISELESNLSKVKEISSPLYV